MKGGRSFRRAQSSHPLPAWRWLAYFLLACLTAVLVVLPPAEPQLLAQPSWRRAVLPGETLQWQLQAAGRSAAPILLPPPNDVARRDILEVDQLRDELSLYGQGQIVAVADTGLDTGDKATLSADFGHVRQTFSWGRPGSWSDSNGHGTHVAGSILGSGALSGSDLASHDYEGSFAGVAPEAELVFQSLLDAEGGLGGIPDDLGTLLGQAYDVGARIHSNSWGANFFIKPLARFLTSGRYTEESAQVDRFVWEHPDMVVLFAAGNDGVDYFGPGDQGLELPPPDGVVDPDSLGSPGTAKNVITVGASESLRDGGGHAAERWGKEGDLLSAVMGYSYLAEPLSSDLPSNNANGMAPFSSRGPTNDGRNKPDVVAPGTNIVSARSHDPGAGELFGAYDDNYVYCSGTSMATPLVAGVVTLIRQWYMDRQAVPEPSAALIKATLINGTVDISPGQFGAGPSQDVPDAWPNPVTGWGRVSLRSSLPFGTDRELWHADEKVGLAAGQEATFTRYAAADDQPLRVTLVWSDPPAAAEPEELKLPGVTERPPAALVNDLDLTVEAPDGRRFLGNMGEDPDRLNNVEAVRIIDPAEGDYRIVVRGQSVIEGPQPFALVISGARVISGPRPTPAVSTAEPVTKPEKEEAEGMEGWVIGLLAGMGVLIIGLGGVLVYRLRAKGSGRDAGTALSGQAPSRPALAGLGGYPMVSLAAEKGPLSGQRVAVRQSPFTIGRSADNDLVLAETPVSRHHAQLEGRPDRWFLHDTGSANGTFLNHQRVVTAQPLRSGDLIGIGDSVFLFTVEAAPVAPAARAPQVSLSRRRLFVAGIAGAVILLLLAAALVLALRGEQGKQPEQTPGLGLPTIEIPGIDIPTVSLPTGIPTVEIPTFAVPTGMPTLEVPTGGIPTGIPTGLDMIPLPTGGLPLPPLPLPTQ